MSDAVLVPREVAELARELLSWSKFPPHVEALAALGEALASPPSSGPSAPAQRLEVVSLPRVTVERLLRRCGHDPELIDTMWRALNAPAPSASTEIGWLIERENTIVGGPLWWAGDGWSSDSLDAIRFARKLDAEEAARWHKIGGFATEHAWVPPPQPTPEEP